MPLSASLASRRCEEGTEQTGSLSGERVCCKGHTDRRQEMTKSPEVAIKKVI